MLSCRAGIEVERKVFFIIGFKRASFFSVLEYPSYKEGRPHR